MSIFMTIADFQKTYSVSRSTVYRLAASGVFEFTHIGRAVRIKREDAEKWCAALSQNPSNEP